MKVLIAIDDSDCSKKALESVSNRHWSKDDEIRVIMVVDIYEFVPAYYYDDSTAINSVKKVLEEAVDGLKAKFPEATISSTIVNGFVKSSLVEICDQWKPDLLVVGSHGKKGFKKLLLGSVSNALLLSAPCPVLIVKENDLTVGGEFKTVLVSIDCSEHSKVVVENVLKNNWPEDVNFKVFSVVEDIGDVYCMDFAGASCVDHLSEYRKSREKELDKVCGEAVKKLGDAFGAKRVSSEISFGYPAEEILKQAESSKAGLIVLGSHGRNFMERLIIGSVSNAVANQSYSSVEVVKDPSIREKEEKKAAKEVESVKL